MKTNYPEIPWVDPNFDENQNKVPWEALEPYVNQHVAWSWDGTAILAGAPTREELYRKLDEQGTDSNRVVFDFIPDPNVSYF